MEEQLFYYLTAVPVLGTFAQWLAWRFRLPSILLLLVFGVGLGSIWNIDHILAELTSEATEIAEEVSADDGSGTMEVVSESRNVAHRLAGMILFPLVSLSVAIILFEGGLSLRLRELQSAGRTVFLLVTVGAVVTFGFTFLLAWWILDLNPRIAALLGGVLVVTGPTVVIPLLRQIRPSRTIGSIIKWEGIVIDPVGAILAVLVFEQLFVGIQHELTVSESILVLLLTVVTGLVVGWLAAQMLIQMVKRFLVPDFLHGVFFLATALLVFALSNFLQEESGLVTVTIMGIVLANQKAISIDHVFHFKENLRVFLISCLFIVLGSRVDISAMSDLGWQGVLFLAALILLVRPVAVMISTIGSGLSRNEKLFLAFLAPRGIVAAAVSSVFSLKIAALLAGDPEQADLVADAERIVPITFLIIFGTVLVYGLAASPLARALHLDDSDPQGILFAGADRWVCEVALAVKEAGFGAYLVDTNYRKIAEAKMKGLDAQCISILSEQFIEENDFAGIGRLVAATRSDEVNALATNEFAEIFGRSNIYQLPPLKKGVRSSLADKLKARTVFQQELNFDQIRERFDQGWKIKTTKLTEEFKFADFRARYDGEFVVFFVVSGQDLRVITPSSNLEPKPGQTLISMVPSKPQPNKTPEAAS